MEYKIDNLNLNEVIKKYKIKKKKDKYDIHIYHITPDRDKKLYSLTLDEMLKQKAVLDKTMLRQMKQFLVNPQNEPNIGDNRELLKSIIFFFQGTSFTLSALYNNSTYILIGSLFSALAVAKNLSCQNELDQKFQDDVLKYIIFIHNEEQFFNSGIVPNILDNYSLEDLKRLKEVLIPFEENDEKTKGLLL